MAEWEWLWFGVSIAVIGFALVRSLRGSGQHNPSFFLWSMLLAVLLAEAGVRLIGAPESTLLNAYRVVLVFGFLAIFLTFHYWKSQAAWLYDAKSSLQGFFSYYLSPKVIQDLVSRGHVPLGGKRRDVTVLVTDVRNSTKLALDYPAEKVVKSLNAYFELASQSVARHGGVVDKITGDGVMAVFNALNVLPDHTMKAFYAAAEIQQAMPALNEKLRNRGLPVLSAGAGIDAGDAVVGNIGSRHMVRFTVIGDVANTANRVQEAAKDGQVVLTEAAYRRVAGHVKGSGPKTVMAKNKGPVSVYVVNVV
ncbi:adenylate/guanylate cyclase domain-containing protein [Candidatus Micrarchaeota archaeon]|nr:adenylate/guanylate cyclase domain-containing protein [Candidatus Micrarchaeota archaeon]